MKVLVAVLNWGLGHAARCVPVIRLLIQSGYKVVIASDGDALHLLHKEFPLLPFYELPPYAIHYSRTGAGLPWRMMIQLPRLKMVIAEEHRLIGEIVRKENVHVILSDNRYGAYHAAVKSVWLGHQLQLLMPRGWKWLSGPVNTVHRKMLGRFQEYWVPDEPGLVLSGALSQFDKKVRYTGVLSRFSPQVFPSGKEYEVVAVLSGPEPQRTLLENKLRVQLPRLPVRSLLVRGLAGEEKIRQNESFDEADFLGSHCLNALLCKAVMVVARSGYSTLMDLSILGKKALFIPTPGQPEQEYLARRAEKQGWALVQNQYELSVLTAWKNLDAISGLPAVYPSGLLQEAIDTLSYRFYEKVYT